MSRGTPDASLKQTLVVTRRLPRPTDRWWTSHTELSVARSPRQLAELAERDALSVVVFDTSLREDSRFPDIADILRVLEHQLDVGRSGFQVLLSAGETESSLHLAEEVTVLMRASTMARALVGVTCGDGDCIVRALGTARSGRIWQDPHLPARKGIHVPTLFEELQARRLFAEVMVAFATQPAGWPQIAVRLCRNASALRNELARSIHPALVRLGWESIESTPQIVALASHAVRRREYLVRYAKRYRPDLAHLAAA